MKSHSFVRENFFKIGKKLENENVEKIPVKFI